MSAHPSVHTTSAELYQMQTPPPTRGSTTKRRSQRIEPAIFGTPSSMSTRLPQQPEQQAYMTNQRPFSEAAPLVMPNNGLTQPPVHFFNPPSGPHMADIHPNMMFGQPLPNNQHGNPSIWNGVDDPFATTFAPATSNVSSEQPPCPSTNALRRTASQKSRQLSTDTNASLNHGGHHYTDRSSPVKAHVTSASVDPSLVYSSPSRPVTSESMHSNPIFRPSSSTGQSRIAYQYKTSEPRDDMQGARVNRFNPPQLQHPAHSFSARPDLQRSNTVAGLRSSSSQATPDSTQPRTLTRSNSAMSMPRRSSPLKRDRGSRVSLSSISETPKPALRTSVVLKVDANGNARTETQVIEASPAKSLLRDKYPALEISPTKSLLRDRYPTLWDDSDSDSDSLPSGATKQRPSRNTSSTHGRGEERYVKAAKLDPPSEDLENLHLPRSNSSASLRTPSKAAYAAAAQLRRQSSAKKQPRPSSHVRRNTLASLNSSFESLPSVDLSGDDRTTQTDAGSALRQMMASRNSTNRDMQQIQPQAQPDPVSASIQKPPTNMGEPHKIHQKSQSFAAPAQNYNNQSFGPASVFPVDCAPMQPAPPLPIPVTNHMTTPIFRCICNLPLDDGRGTLQCSFCAMYLHTTCLGIDPQRLPTTYMCNFCTHTANTFAPSSTQSFPGWGIAGI